MKVILASGVRKSISEEIIFIKLAFNTSNFFDLVDIDFLNFVKSDFLYLAEFVMLYKFLIFSSIPLLVSLVPASHNVF